MIQLFPNKYNFFRKNSAQILQFGKFKQKFLKAVQMPDILTKHTVN